MTDLEEKVLSLCSKTPLDAGSGCLSGTYLTMDDLSLLFLRVLKSFESKSFHHK